MKSTMNPTKTTKSFEKLLNSLLKTMKSTMNPKKKFFFKNSVSLFVGFIVDFIVAFTNTTMFSTMDTLLASELSWLFRPLGYV